MKTWEIVTLVAIVCGIIGAVGALILTIVDLHKILKKAKEDREWEKIMQIVYKAVEAAEKTRRPGSEKKLIAIAIVVTKCKNIGIELSDNQFKRLIDCIDLTINFFNSMIKVKQVGAGRKA